MNGREMSGKWFEIAKQDYQLEVFVQDMYPVPVGAICYHCEQSAEKMLKGFLVACEVEPPKTHDLVLLCKMCEEQDARFEQLAEPCLRLTPYGVNVRYPSGEELDEVDMKRALTNCSKIHDFVEKVIAESSEE